MEFMNRSPQGQPGPAASSPAAAGSSHKSGRVKSPRLFQWASIVLLFSATILVVALVLSLFFGGAKPEGKYVNKGSMQAVFLNNGQVYFGNIRTLNDKYVRVGNIYYLRVNQQVQPNQSTTNAAAQDISLVKLGCELHGPADEMLINRDQVTFWENLKSDGQVAKAVTEYVKQNPNGQKCDTSAASNSSTTNTNSTTTPTTNTTTTPSSSTTKKQ